jgi:hypothetical protein
MINNLEKENEELKKQLESAYEEILNLQMKISSYAVLEMTINMQNANSFLSKNITDSFINSSTILVNNQTYNDILKWSNNNERK